MFSLYYLSSTEIDTNQRHRLPMPPVSLPLQEPVPGSKTRRLLIPCNIGFPLRSPIACPIRFSPFSPTKPGFWQAQPKDRDVLQDRIRRRVIAQRHAEATTSTEHPAATDGKVLRDTHGQVGIDGILCELQPHSLPRSVLAFNNPLISAQSI